MERLRHRPGRQRDLAGQNAIQQIALREILIERARTHDRPRNAGGLQFRLGALCARLASAGQQDHPLQPGPARNGGKLGYRFGRAFHRQVGLVGHIGAGDAVKRRCPAFWPFPVERRFGGTRDRSCGDAARPEPRIDAAPVFPPPPMMRIVPCDMILTSTIFHRLGVTDRHG